jgi:hypothetical protein
MKYAIISKEKKSDHYTTYEAPMGGHGLGMSFGFKTALFETEMEATVKAKQLAGEHPQNVYYVLAPVQQFQTASSPVESTPILR